MHIKHVHTKCTCFSVFKSKTYTIITLSYNKYQKNTRSGTMAWCLSKKYHCAYCLGGLSGSSRIPDQQRSVCLFAALI